MGSLQVPGAVQGRPGTTRQTVSAVQGGIMSRTTISLRPRGRDFAERRGSIRFPCELAGECQPLAVMETGNHWPARTCDLSVGGVSLLLSRRFEPGTLLALSLTNRNTDSACPPLARVCRVTVSNKHWLLGCTWARELETDDLRYLVGPAAMWETLRARAGTAIVSVTKFLKELARTWERERVEEWESRKVRAHFRSHSLTFPLSQG